MRALFSLGTVDGEKDVRWQKQRYREIESKDSWRYFEVFDFEVGNMSAKSNIGYIYKNKWDR